LHSSTGAITNEWGKYGTHGAVLSSIAQQQIDTAGLCPAQMGFSHLTDMAPPFNEANPAAAFYIQFIY
jgi:hypothetical protein